MRNIFIIFLLFIGVCFYNKVFFIPFVYQKLYDFSLENYGKKKSLFKVMEQEKVSDIYHKLVYLKKSDRLDLFPKKITLNSTNLFSLLRKTESEEREKSAYTWAFYSLYEPLEFFQIFSENGVTVGEVFNYLKFTFGVPFRLKDEINILYDIYVNKAVYSSTLFRSSELIARFLPSEKILGINLNEKYVLMIMDLYESSQRNLELTLFSESNGKLYKFLKNSSTGFKNVSIIQRVLN